VSLWPGRPLPGFSGFGARGVCRVQQALRPTRDWACRPASESVVATRRGHFARRHPRPWKAGLRSIRR